MNIKNYIQSNESLRELDFLTVYLTIIELIKGGKMEYEPDV